MRRLLPYCTLLLLLLFSFDLNAQKSKAVKNALEKFEKLFGSQDSVYTDSMLRAAARVINEENQARPKDKDSVFLASFLIRTADFAARRNRFLEAGRYYNAAYSEYKKSNNEKQQIYSFSKYLYCYERYFKYKVKNTNGQERDTSVFVFKNQDTTVWLSTFATKVNKSRRRGDTVFVAIKAGRNQGVFEDARLDVFTTFDTFSTFNRPSKLAGRGRITRVYDNTSTGYIVRLPEVDGELYIQDCWTVQAKVPGKNATGVNANMALNNIKLRSFDKKRYYIQGAGNLLLDPAINESFIRKAFLNDLVEAEAYYSSFNTEIFDAKVDTGRFKGKTYREVVNMSTDFDVWAFLDFVNAFPARYINKDTGFSFIEVYLTWVINNCRTGKDELGVVKKLISLSSEEIKSRPAVWRGYYNALNNGDSLIWDFVYNNWQDQPKERVNAYLRMREFSRLTGMSGQYAFYTERAMREYSTMSDYKNLSAFCDELLKIQTDPVKRRNSYFFKGSALSSLEDPMGAVRYYDSALLIDTSFYWAIGQKGWAQTKMMSLYDALKNCLYAYQFDSSLQWTTINLAHVYLLQGSKAEAYRLYDKALSNSTSEGDFYTGMIGDFDYFLKKGIQVTEFKSIKEKLIASFEKDLKYKLRSDSIMERAKAIKDKENYLTAIDVFKKGLEEEMKVNPVRWDIVRRYNRWIGYCYYKRKDYGLSVKYYTEGSEVTLSKGLGDDLLISDYDDMATLSDFLNDSIRQLEYTGRKNAVETALEEKREKKRLFAIIIGASANGKNDLRAEQDAADMAELLNSGSALQFESVKIDVLTGSKCTPENLLTVIDSVIRQAREQDVFVFYYSGHASRTLKNERLVMPGGSIDYGTLANSMELINAGRQIHILDCNALSWRDWYTKQHFSILNNPKKSLMFAGYKNSRIENKNDKNGLLTSSMKSAYRTETAHGNVSSISWLASSVTALHNADQLFPLEMLAYGHDFTIGKFRKKFTGVDSTPPLIELPGARKTRGEPISLVTPQSIRSGSITDQSKIVEATANGIALVISSTGRFDLPAELYDKDKIEIYAKDEFGNASTEVFQVLYDNNPATSEGTRYAYLIASDAYKHWSPLSNPVYDAITIGKLLRDYFGYKVEIDSNLSKDQIEAKLYQIRTQSYKSRDQLLVFFAGHGVYDSIRQGSYVCVDSRPVAEDKLFNSYIRQREIVEMLDGTNCKNVFLVMDVCFGGKMFDKQQRNRYVNINDGHGKTPEEFINQYLDIPCRQFLTSGGNNYVSDGTPGAHSPFASRFIRALEDGAADPQKKYITASEVMDYLRNMSTIGNDWKSFPRYGSFGGNENGEFVLPVARRMSAPGKSGVKL
jgi:tetratricopeptide (TPR) repeat protein